jgi:hypothetical protein
MTHSLDDLVRAIQSALGAAERALRDRQKARVVRHVQLNAGGDTEGEAWFLSVETGEVQDGKPVVARIPMMSLMTVGEMRPTVMKVAMLATVETVKPPHENGKSLLGLRIAGANARVGKPGMHKVELELSGEDYREVEVRIDGKLLKRIGGDQG